MHIRKVAYAGVVAALYAALTLAVAPVSYGPIQFRIAEVLSIMPFFYPVTAFGLFIGCVIANLLSPYGAIDIIAGSFATLAAALCTMRLGKASRESFTVKALACFPPVFFNALIIGAVIAWSETGGGEAFRLSFAINGLQVGGGQLVVMYILGLPLMVYLPKTRFFAVLSEIYNI